MVDTTFVDQVTVIEPAWLNDVNDYVYTTAPAAISALQAEDSRLDTVKAERVASIYDLIQISTPSDDDSYYVIAFYDGELRGSGLFHWNSTRDKADADGGIIIDPDNIGGFDGTVSTLAAYLTAQGGGVGSGCWERQYEGNVYASWFGAKAGEDIYAAMQAALDTSIDVTISSGDYDLSDTLNAKRAGQRISAIGGGNLTQTVRLLWSGATSATTPMLYVATTYHAPQIYNIYFDGNTKAGICIHFDAEAGSSLHNPDVNSCCFIGYTSKAVVVGEDDTVNLSNAQLQIPRFTRCQWKGCNGTPAIGVLINGQNAEHVIFDGCWFDPTSGYEHSYHIYQRSGGMILNGIVTTRSNGYGLVIYDRTTINGYNTEDRYILQSQSVALSPGIHISNLDHRSGSAVASDASIDFRHTEGTVFMSNVTVKNGDIRIGGTDQINVTAFNVTFDGGGSWSRPGTNNSKGIIHNLTNGSIDLRGDAPAIYGYLDNSSTAFSIVNGRVFASGTLYNDTIADSTNVDVIDDRDISTNREEVIEILSTNSSGSTVEGKYQVKVWRAEGSNVYSVVTEEFETSAATVSVTNNANGTYDVNFANASGATLRVRVRTVSEQLFGNA